MKRTILKSYMIILSVGILLCAAVCAVIFDLEITETTEKDLGHMVTAMAQSFDSEGDPGEEAMRLSEAVGWKRVTIIRGDGVVLADSQYDAASMGNHLDRTEIRQADYQKVGHIIRESETLGYKMIYAATKTGDGYYIRVAGEYAGLLSDFISFLPAIFGAAALAMLVASLLANRFAKSVSAPISSLSDSMMGVKDGRVALNPENYPYEELQDMAREINRLSGMIKQNMDRLKEEKNKIDYLLDNMNEGFVLLDREGTILIINQKACQFFQCGKNAVEKGFLRISREMDFINGLEQVIKTGEPVCFDSEAEGRVIEANLYFVKENTYEEFTGGVIIILTDVTENRRAIAMRRDFFSNASHELKTPMTSIKGFAEMMTSGMEVTPEQQRVFLERIGAEAARMNDLINDIILISKMESGELASELREQDFASAVSECIAEARPLAEQEEIRIQTHLEPCKVIADQRDLYSLAGNLISNAIKYNRKGGLVEIWLEDRGDHLFFQVLNEGEAIPKEKQARVFERFYRLDQGRTKSVGGTGLGLAIVKHIIERYKGSVELKSSPEEGTTFTVRLPK